MLRRLALIAGLLLSLAAAQSATAATPPPSVKASAALLVDGNTGETIFALNDEAQRYRQLPECLLIRFDCGQPRNQIPFAVSCSTRVELAVMNRCASSAHF